MFQPVEYFCSKQNVLVIGNAENVKETNYSKYDCIIRINLGINSRPIHVWVNGLLGSDHAQIVDIPDHVHIMRLNCEHNERRMKRMPKHLIGKSYFWNYEQFQEMCKTFNYPRPTTGFIITYWLILNTKCNITITGFDFFETLNRYTKETVNKKTKGAYLVHDTQKERSVFLEWARAGKIILK